PARAGADQPDRARGGVREVDGSAVDEGPAVVDADLDRAPVCQVRHHHARPERQRGMGRGELVLVVYLAVRGPVPVEAGAVPRRDADLHPVDDGWGRRLPKEHAPRSAERHREPERDPPSPPHPRRALSTFESNLQGRVASAIYSTGDPW